MTQKSFAHSRPDLPGSPALQKAKPVQRDFGAAKAQEAARGSEMVARSKPAPAPRPSLDLAGQSDRAAFNAQWSREQRRADFVASRVKAQHQRRLRDRMRE